MPPKETAMPGLTDEKFFLCIIKQMDGKIDWQKVADECSIVSKAAAQKRFSRAKAKYESGDPGSASPTKASTPAADGETPAPKKKSTRKPAAKKRKVEEVAEEDDQPVKEESED